MADLNTGTLKGSIVINFGSVRKAEQAIKSLQAQFSGYVKQSNSATKAAQDYTKAAQQQAKATRTQSVSQERILKGYTQLEQAEKQLLVLKRQSAAETHEGTVALKNAAAAVNSYRATLQSTNVTSLRLTDSHETMQQQLIRASVATTGLNSATANARSWFRSSRAAASQFGLQLQDVAVQAQMGTNALVILGQQGSQLLGFFGAGGALAGAVLAIGAAIAFVASSAGQAKKATKELGDALDYLDSTLEKTEEGTYRLTQRIVEMSKISKEAAEIELARSLTESANAFNESIKAIQSTASQQLNVSIFGDIDRAFSQVEKLNAQGRRLSSVLENAQGAGLVLGFDAAVIEARRLGKEFNITETAAADLIQQIALVRSDSSEDNLIALGKLLREITVNTEGASGSFVKLASSLGGFITKALRSNQLSEEARKLLKDFDKTLRESEESLNSSGRSTQTAAEEAAEYIARLKEEAETVSLSDRALVAYNIRKIASKDATVDNAEALIKEGRGYVATVKAAERRLKLLEEEKKRRELLLDQIQDDYEKRQDFLFDGQQSQVMIQAIQLRSVGVDEAAIKDFMRRQQVIIDQRAKEISTSPFGDIETFELELAQREQALINALGREQAMMSDHWQRLQENAEQVKPLLQVADWAKTTGEALGYMGNVMDQATSTLEAMGKKGSKEWKAFAMAQATVNTAMAIMNAWVMATEAGKMAGLAGPAVTSAIGVSMTAMLSAMFGAQIAQIQSANYATGGMVRGPGTGTSDSIPANLSNGEFVMRADAVRKIGVTNLNAMNQGRMANFAQGGSVGVVSGGSGNTTVNVIDQRSGGAPVETRESTDQFGNRSIEMIIKDVVRNGISRGDFDRDMQGNFGVRRPGRRV